MLPRKCHSIGIAPWHFIRIDPDAINELTGPSMSATHNVTPDRVVVSSPGGAFIMHRYNHPPVSLSSTFSGRCASLSQRTQPECNTLLTALRHSRGANARCGRRYLLN